MSEEFWIRLGLGLVGVVVIWMLGAIWTRIEDGEWDFSPVQLGFGVFAVVATAVALVAVLAIGEGLGRLFGLFDRT